MSAHDPTPITRGPMAVGRPTLARADRALVILVPRNDRPRWVVLAIVATTALVCGWFWPRACGIKFGNDVVEENPNNAASAEPASSVEAPPQVTAPVTATATAPTTPDSLGFAAISVGKSTLMHCQDPPAAELKPSHCGDPVLDTTITPKLEELGACPSAANVVGRLSITVDVNFKTKAVKVSAGKSSVKKNGVPNDKAIEPLVSCLRASLHDVGDSPTPFDHARYVIAYPISLASPTGVATPSSPGNVKEVAASGTAKVEVDAALVRDAPNTNGTLVGRLTRGTKVDIVGLAGHWYHVKFGENDGSEGWIFRTNIGK